MIKELWFIVVQTPLLDPREAEFALPFPQDHGPSLTPAVSRSILAEEEKRPEIGLVSEIRWRSFAMFGLPGSPFFMCFRIDQSFDRHAIALSGHEREMPHDGGVVKSPNRGDFADVETALDQTPRPLFGRYVGRR